MAPLRRLLACPTTLGLGFLPDGRLLIVSMRDRQVLRCEADGSLVEHADLSALAPWHCNDMLVDRDGRPPRSTVLIGIEPAFTVNAGSLGERRTWASFGDPPASTDLGEALGQLAVASDGICLDAEGAMWIADSTHRRLVRVAEGGSILEERKTDGIGVFVCMPGGDDGRTLFACVVPTFHQAAASPNHRAAIWMTKVESTARRSAINSEKSELV
jgi:hypothetical protein